MLRVLLAPMVGSVRRELGRRGSSGHPRVLPGRLARILDGPQRLDARLFHRANLFVTATRS